MQKLRHILTQLLSVYLLVLMVLPCSDAHARTAAIEKVQFSAQEHEHIDSHICTPFCVCSGCTAAIVLQAVVNIEPIHFTISMKSADNFYQSVNSHFFGSIWQPPQII